MLNFFKQIDALFVASTLSYIIYMVIIPKAITISIVAVLFGTLLITFGAQMLKNGKCFIPIYSKKYFPFVVFSVLSIFWTVNSDYSFPLIRILLTFEFGTLTCLFLKREEDLNIIVKGFVCGGMISSAVVLLYQAPLIGLIRLGSNIYGSAMEFSGGVTISAYCCLFLWKKESNKIYLVLFFAFLCICALSGSRSAIIYPFIFFSLLMLFYNQRVGKLLKYGVLLFAICLGVLYLSLKVPVLYSVVGHRVETLLEDRTEDGSYMERKEMKEYAIACWKEKPFWGLGINGFAKKYAMINKPVYSHCDYTEILCCFGLIGAILFYEPLVSLLFRRKIFHCAKRNWNQSFMLTILCFTFFEVTHSIVFLDVKQMMLVAVCFVFFARKEKRAQVLF